ncbi:MAG: preprotein translocase subunit SecG [Candidatus Cloacimonetes bacterium]|nr:preprotein translocase subunit SecG [Candidatus Cloacimonadota bacterium]
MVLYTIALVIHIIISVALVLVILSQTSKGGLDANLGGAAMNVFGGSGASKFLRKWTQILGVVFVASCLFLAFQVSNVTVAKAPKILDEKFGDTPAAAQQASPEAQSGTQPAQTPAAEPSPTE